MNATSLIEKINNLRYMSERAHGEVVDAQRLFKEKTDAFKKSYKEKNSLEILPDEEDDCYEDYRAQLKKDCKNEQNELQKWKHREGVATIKLPKWEEALDKEIKTSRNLVLEWKQAKIREAKQSAKIPIKQKRKSSDSNKKSPKVKKAKPAQTPPVQPPAQPPTQPPAAFSSDDSDSGSSDSFVEA